MVFNSGDSAMSKRIIAAAVTAFALTVSSGALLTSLQAQDSAVQKPTFSADGSVSIPANWRSWVFIGTPLTPNALNDGAAPFPEFHNVYIEPGAFAHFQKTGEFANGTQIAKELVLVRAKDADDMHADGSTNEVSGRGYFQGEFQGLELAYKDTERFAAEPGGWVYYSFGHKAPPYEKTAKAFPTESCNACHEASADTDFVFTQFYPVLRSEMKKSEMKK